MSAYMPIGLTGGIASGKSTVSCLFRQWGAFICDADAISRRALDPGTPCYDQTVRAFGAGILRPDGTVDRKGLAAIVFSDDKALSTLNGIIHPYVRTQMRNASRESFETDPHRLIVWDVPLLFESGYHADVAKTVVVTASQRIRLQRIMARDGATRAEALSRIRSQMPEQEKVKRADMVIRNSGTEEQLQVRARKVYDALIAAMDRNP